VSNSTGGPSLGRRLKRPKPAFPLRPNPAPQEDAPSLELLLEALHGTDQATLHLRVLSFYRAQLLLEGCD
jgi:hypothetical protein